MKEIILKYQEINYEDIINEEKLLINSASGVAKSAYSPYSKFNVGVAILLDNREIVLGKNQENASFPCGICAERVALGTAATNYPNIIIKKIAITAFSNNFKINNPVGPCGLCRQVILEHEVNQDHNIEILLFNQKKMIKIANAKNLLPFHFNETKLKK